MSELSTFPLRLPRHIKEDAAAFAKREGASTNQFISLAVAEKIATLKAREYFSECAKHADMGKFLAILNRPSSPPPYPGDEIPE